MLAAVGNANTYDVSVAEVIEATKDHRAEEPGRVRVLQPGHVPARPCRGPRGGRRGLAHPGHRPAAHPAADDATTFALTEADIPDGRSADTWRTAGGRPTGTAGVLPAGTSTWTTAADMTLFIWAVLTNQAPEWPRWSGGRSRQRPDRPGLADHEFENRELTWHNGGTGGMRSMLALDGSGSRAWSCWATPAAGSTARTRWRPATGLRPRSTVPRCRGSPADRHLGRPGVPGRLRLRALRARTSSRSPSVWSPGVSGLLILLATARGLRARLDLGPLTRRVGRPGGVRGGAGSGPTAGAGQAGVAQLAQCRREFDRAGAGDLRVVTLAAGWALPLPADRLAAVQQVWRPGAGPAPEPSRPADGTGTALVDRAAATTAPRPAASRAG